MPEFEKSIQRARLEAALNRLVKIGWVKSFVIRDVHDTIDLEWTVKGRERARQVIEIVTEFHGGANDLVALAVICRSHPPFSVD